MAGAALIATLLLPAPAGAQGMGLNLRTVVGNVDTDAFGCGAGNQGGQVICNIYHRIYADVEPSNPNAAAFADPIGQTDGWPTHRPTPQRYVGDLNSSFNWGPTSDTAFCEAWYAIHTATLNPGDGTFLSYYGSQSQIGNGADNGGSSLAPDCAPDAPTTDACFGALDAVLHGGPVSPNTPGGDLGPRFALAVVPVPSVTASDAAGGTVDLFWPGQAPANTTNLPSVDPPSFPCPAGSTFDDLNDTNGPNPVWGVGLFVHTIPDSGAFRSLASLEGGGIVGANNALDVLTNPGDRLACTGTGTDPNCPGVHQIRCDATAATGGVCVGDGVLFAPVDQNIQLSQADVDAALGADGPLDGTNNAVFNTKVYFRGSVAGSTATASPASPPNPSLVTLFSANSSRVSFGALVSTVVFDGEPVVQGNRVTLSWSTIGGPFIEFRVQRADDGVSFTELGTVAATGADSYQFTDTFRGRRPSSATYRLIVVEPSGESQILTTVDLSPGSRSPRR